MPRDKLPNEEPDLLDKLFGNPAELADEDLNMLYESLAPGSDPAAIVHEIAESAAVEYRLQQRVPPDHIQAALNATRQVKSLDNETPSRLQQIIDAMKAPFTGPVNDPAFAYRNKKSELDTDDQAIIDDLTDELRQDWGDKEETK